MSLQFCRECNSLLRPRERSNKLYYGCQHCDFEVPAEDPCVYENRLTRDTATRLETIQSDVRNDPTLQRSDTAPCSECGHSTAVFFQAEQTARSESLSLIFVCCNCGHKWIG